MPRDDLPGGDPKRRRHVLLSDPGHQNESAVFALGSTKYTEAERGARHYLVNPAATNYQGSGFSKPTYVYPSILVPVDFDGVEGPVGHVREAIGPLLRQLRLALGIGSGTCEQGTAGGSYRGRMVEFSQPITDRLHTRYGLIVTEPRYSEARRYQTIVPLLDGLEMEAMQGDVMLEGADWMTGIGFSSGLLAIADVMSLWHHDSIQEVTRIVVEPKIIRAVDDSLCGLFGL